MSFDSHHAILVRTTEVDSLVTDTFVSTGEIVNYFYEKLGIDEARQINSAAHVRPTEADIQTFVVRTHFITLEAQNALLKVVEEPPVSTRFVLVIPADFTVLPTILSRCEVYIDNDLIKPNQTFTDFLETDLKGRLESIDKAAKAKDVQWQRNIKNGLIQYVKSNTSGVVELEYCARLLLTRGASNKFLLEHAALTLPTSSRV